MRDIIGLCRQYAAAEGDTSYGATFADAANEIERLHAFVRSISDAKLDLYGMDARNALQTIQNQAKAELRN